MAKPSIYTAVYTQFLYFVEEEMRNKCCPFNECNFDWCLDEEVRCKKIMTIIWEGCDKCKKKQHKTIQLDVTNVCFSDFDAKPPKLLYKLREYARKFVAEICPAKFEPRCIVEPPKKENKWVPYETETTTTILMKKVPANCEKPKVIKKVVTETCCKPVEKKDETVIYEYCSTKPCKVESKCKCSKVYNVDGNTLKRIVVEDDD